MSPRAAQKRTEDALAARSCRCRPWRTRSLAGAAGDYKAAGSGLRVDTAPVLPVLEPTAPLRRESPVFRVESRLVEVPVLVEAGSDRRSPALTQKDFRIYEDDAVMETAFFSEGVQGRASTSCAAWR